MTTQSLTEGDAHFKRCCVPLLTEKGTCIASACMAWRWSEHTRTQAWNEAIVEHAKATGDNLSQSTQKVALRRAEFHHTEGYCGLAGRPEA